MFSLNPYFFKVCFRTVKIFKQHIFQFRYPSSMNTKPKPVLAPLPDTFYEGLKSSEKDATAFFETRVKECDRREIPDEFKKTLVLEAQKLRRTKFHKPRISKKMLTSKEKRELGLSRLPKIGLNYQQFQV